MVLDHAELRYFRADFASHSWKADCRITFSSLLSFESSGRTTHIQSTYLQMFVFANVYSCIFTGHRCIIAVICRDITEVLVGVEFVLSTSRSAGKRDPAVSPAHCVVEYICL